MAQASHLIMDLLRIITPEEVGEITTKHNGGKFLSLTDLVNERVQKNIYRNFSQPFEIADEPKLAKILPFKLDDLNSEETLDNEKIETLMLDPEALKKSLSELAENMARAENQTLSKVEHKDDENMSSFILIEKARIKRAQNILKQKEILELYTKNANVDVEQIKGQDSDISESRESGVLVNKKHY